MTEETNSPDSTQASNASGTDPVETVDAGAATAVETLDIGELHAGEEAPAEQIRPLAEPATPDAGGFIWGTGRRKSAVARVRIKPGEGKFLIKGKQVSEFFSEPQHQNQCLAPLKSTGMEGKLDIYVNTSGGGITGQAGAVMLGLARALKGYDPTLEQALRDEGYLTRDARKVERKKYGQSGARRRFQFSKR